MIMVMVRMVMVIMVKMVVVMAGVMAAVAKEIGKGDKNWDVPQPFCS